MSGHVFHPGHQELHGITVVLDTHGPRTYVGRFDTQDDAGVHLRDVAVYEASPDGEGRDAYLQRTMKFGVRAERKHLVIPTGEVAKIVPLSALGS